MTFSEIEFPIRVIYSSKKIHKIDYPYEFRNKKGKDVYGIVKQAICEYESEVEDCVIYKVEMENGEFKYVNHDTNREI